MKTEAKRQQVVEALDSGPRGGLELTVGQVMTADPYCIRASTTVPELLKIYHANQFRHLLVLDDHQNLAGVLSDRDVLSCLGPTPHLRDSLLGSITAGQIMSTDVLSIHRTAPVAQAVELMIEHGISCLPVMEDGELAGILTNTDVNIVLCEVLEALRHAPAEESFETVMAGEDGM